MKPLYYALATLALGAFVGFWGGYALAQYRLVRLWREASHFSAASEAKLRIDFANFIDSGDIERARFALLLSARLNADAATKQEPSFFSWRDFIVGPFVTGGDVVSWTRDNTSEAVTKVRAAISRACAAPLSVDRHKYLCDS